MRVIAGSAKGRKLRAVPGEGTRPITDRVKGALFNIIGADIEGATLLDLFAGTGAVGIEALSRGAARVVFIDNALQGRADAAPQPGLHLELTERAEVVQGRCLSLSARRPTPRPSSTTSMWRRPNIRTCGPRRSWRWTSKPLLAPDGLIIVQIHPKEHHDLPLQRLAACGERHYGSTVLHFYTPVQSGPPRLPPGDGHFRRSRRRGGQPMLLDVQPGDVVQLRKPHPCGSIRVDGHAHRHGYRPEMRRLRPSRDAPARRVQQAREKDPLPRRGAPGRA